MCSHKDQQGDCNEYTQHTIFNIKKKITLKYYKSAATGIFLGTQKRVKNSHGKRAISIQDTEVLLYFLREANLFTSLYNKTCPNRDLLLKEEVCSQRRKFCP